MTQPSRFSRRRLLQRAPLYLAAPYVMRFSGAAEPPDDGRWQLPESIVQLGDVQADRALLWGRSDRPAQFIVETAIDAQFNRPRRYAGPRADSSSDFTARLTLTDLRADRELFYRAWFEHEHGGGRSAALTGRVRTPSLQRRDLRFVWGGDTAGQGWGINPDFGGMKIYAAMRAARPDFFIHSGDTIYADSPIAPTQVAEGGRVWKNLVTPQVAKVAETLDEYRGRYRYNLLDAAVRRFNAEVPQIWQWDDHEVMNNWSAAKDLTVDARYVEKRVPVHITRARQAFAEYAPLPTADSAASPVADGRIYRKLSYGELLDVFVIDMRSFRGGNSHNRQSEPSDDTALLGTEQLGWLSRELRASRAVWKVIASDMPIGLAIGDGVDAQGRARFEGPANGNGPPLGRELELAALLADLRRARVRNLVWLTADVHYCAAHHYAPERAQTQDFDPFWEFVAGPLHAGSFGPAQLDDTFGPKVVFHKPPPAQNSSPFAGHQFFGQVDIDARTASFNLAFKDADGALVWQTSLEAMAV